MASSAERSEVKERRNASQPPGKFGGPVANRFEPSSPLLFLPDFFRNSLEDLKGLGRERKFVWPKVGLRFVGEFRHPQKKLHAFAIPTHDLVRQICPFAVAFFRAVRQTEQHPS